MHPAGKIGSLVVLALLTSCKAERNAAPVAHNLTLAALEDQAVTGQLAGADPEGDALVFSVLSTQHGTLTSLGADGVFTFSPEADFVGTAILLFQVADSHGLTGSASVTIEVENVSDPPLLSTVPDLRNSPETEVLEYQLSVVDPDPPPHEHVFSVSVADPTIVEAFIEPDNGRLFLKALRLGETDIEVRVADDEFADTKEFRFLAEEVTKGRILRFEHTATGAVVLENETDQPIDFVLEHNRFPVFEDLPSIVRYVQALPSEFDGEDFPGKLWRFVRDSVYHELPLQTDTSVTQNIFYDPWFTLNSLGWGLCGHVAGVYVVIAQAAGYEARVWGLNGHVVPEIRVEGRWRMYDPDLGVYYKNADGEVAGVEELAADPSLITSPYDPIFSGSGYQFPYHPFIAGLYSSTADNFDGGAVFLPEHPTPSARIVIPPRARITYPGRWTPPPPARDGSLAYDVRAYRQALIELDEGWVGELRLPWMAWQITGTGHVEIDGAFYFVGSPELDERLRNTPSPVTSLRVNANGGIRIVLFVNAVRFDIRKRTTVTIRGLNVWGIGVNSTQLQPSLAGGDALDSSLVKPLPSTY